MKGFSYFCWYLIMQAFTILLLTFNLKMELNLNSFNIQQLEINKKALHGSRDLMRVQKFPPRAFWTILSREIHCIV